MAEHTTLLGADPVDLADLTWQAVEDRPLLVVPVGSLEQHGTHLPLDTDTVIATAVAARVAAAIGAVLAPAVPYGASGEHQEFAGTVSVGTAALVQTVVELGRSASSWCGDIVIVNGHGGNTAALTSACRVLAEEGRSAVWLPCAVRGADAHAGRTETSLMLHLGPARVRQDAYVLGNTRPIGDLLLVMREKGVAAVSQSGVLGDPREASMEEGRRILDAMVEGALRRLETSARGVD